MSDTPSLSENHKLTQYERHFLHQQMLREHAEKKEARRDEHKRRRFYRSVPLNTLV